MTPLVGAVLVEQHDDCRVARRYMSADSLATVTTEVTTAGLLIPQECLHPPFAHELVTNFERCPKMPHWKSNQSSRDPVTTSCRPNR